VQEDKKKKTKKGRKEGKEKECFYYHQHIHYIFSAGLGGRVKRRESDRGVKKESLKMGGWGSNTEIKRAREKGE